MKKTLLINGCSYTAGDDIAWDHATHGNWREFHRSTKLDKNQIHDNYTKLIRPQYNFAGVLSRLLNTTSVDLSRDGNNNSEIALTTIGYISQLTPEERKNLHVCIGWTEPARLCRWSNSTEKFTTINVTMLDWYKSNNDDWNKNLYNEFYENSIAWLASAKDIDLLVDGMFRILAVENYLKSEGITYTFWKSLGQATKKSDLVILKKHTRLNFNNLDNSNWIKFTVSDNTLNKHSKEFNELDISTHPYIGIPWRWVLDESYDLYITPGYHPTKIAVEELSKKIMHHIQMTEFKDF